MNKAHFQIFLVGHEGYECVTSFESARQLDQFFSQQHLGVYTAFRSYGHNQFLHLSRHLTRLRESMRRFGMVTKLAAGPLCLALEAIAARYPASEMKVRIDILAEPAQFGNLTTHHLITLSPFLTPPQSSYDEGVSVATTGRIQREDALTKSADFVVRRAVVERLYPGVEDILLLDRQGTILEGASSNFYGVKGDQICTAGQGVLEGTTRRVILQLAEKCGFNTVLKPVHSSELSSLTEAGISSSSRGLMPVTFIDGDPVGQAEVGPVISALMRSYQQYVRDNICSPAQTLRQLDAATREGLDLS